MSYVFVSHAHQDKPFARKLAASLRRAGHAVWIDEAQINVGDSLVDKIGAGLGQVDFVAAILSPASVESAWVTRELDIAANREINEKRVVVLPILVHDVAIPVFLQGKLYADFRDEAEYDQAFARILRALDPADPVQPSSEDEMHALRAELEFVREQARQFEADARRAGEAAFRAKSIRLRAAIETAAERYPHHAPINRTYAFEMDGFVVTLDYALWAIAKAMREGHHVLEALLTLNERWTDLEAMLEAYEEMMGSNEPGAKPSLESPEGQ